MQPGSKCKIRQDRALTALIILWVSGVVVTVSCHPSYYFESESSFGDPRVPFNKQIISATKMMGIMASSAKNVLERNARSVSQFDETLSDGSAIFKNFFQNSAIEIDDRKEGALTRAAVSRISPGERPKFSKSVSVTSPGSVVQPSPPQREEAVKSPLPDRTISHPLKESPVLSPTLGILAPLPHNNKTLSSVENFNEPSSQKKQPAPISLKKFINQTSLRKTSRLGIPSAIFNFTSPATVPALSSTNYVPDPLSLKSNPNFPSLKDKTVSSTLGNISNSSQFVPPAENISDRKQRLINSDTLEATNETNGNQKLSAPKFLETPMVGVMRAEHLQNQSKQNIEVFLVEPASTNATENATDRFSEMKHQAESKALFETLDGNGDKNSTQNNSEKTHTNQAKFSTLANMTRKLENSFSQNMGGKNLIDEKFFELKFTGSPNAKEKLREEKMIIETEDDNKNTSLKMNDSNTIKSNNPLNVKGTTSTIRTGQITEEIINSTTGAKPSRNQDATTDFTKMKFSSQNAQYSKEQNLSKGLKTKVSKNKTKSFPLTDTETSSALEALGDQKGLPLKHQYSKVVRHELLPGAGSHHHVKAFSKSLKEKHGGLGKKGHVSNEGHEALAKAHNSKFGEGGFFDKGGEFSKGKKFYEDFHGHYKDAEKASQGFSKGFKKEHRKGHRDKTYSDKMHHQAYGFKKKFDEEDKFWTHFAERGFSGARQSLGAGQSFKSHKH